MREYEGRTVTFLRCPKCLRDYGVGTKTCECGFLFDAEQNQVPIADFKKIDTYKMNLSPDRKENSMSDIKADTIGGFQQADPFCYGCDSQLKLENAWMTDGCPCNSRLGCNSMNETRWRLLMELQQKTARDNEMLRKALVGLVGSDNRDDLEKLELAVRILPVPDVDKMNTINALQALLQTKGE